MFPYKQDYSLKFSQFSCLMYLSLFAICGVDQFYLPFLVWYQTSLAFDFGYCDVCLIFFGPCTIELCFWMHEFPMKVSTTEYHGIPFLKLPLVKLGSGNGWVPWGNKHQCRIEWYTDAYMRAINEFLTISLTRCQFTSHRRYNDSYTC